MLNRLRPRQNGRHFADDHFKCICLKENIWISIDFSLKFVSNGRINNIPAMAQIMAWRRLGDKPLSEQVMASLQMHICVTRPSDYYLCLCLMFLCHFDFSLSVFLNHFDFCMSFLLYDLTCTFFDWCFRTTFVNMLSIALPTLTRLQYLQYFGHIYLCNNQLDVLF